MSVSVEVGQPCPECGLVDTGSTAGKATRKKVVDRYSFSKSSTGSAKGQKLPKKDKEAGARFDQGVAISRQQNLVLAINKNLPHTAAPGKGHEHGGFTLLKSNNKSMDIKKRRNIEPLRYNKLEILNTVTLSLEQVHGRLTDVSSGHQALLTEYGARVQFGLSPDELAGLLRRLARLESQVTHTLAHVGESPTTSQTPDLSSLGLEDQAGFE